MMTGIYLKNKIMRKNTFFILCSIFFGIYNSSFAQTKYSLTFYNCKRNHIGMINNGYDSIPVTIYDNDSNQKIEFKKGDLPGDFYFITDKTDVRIETENIFKQKIDTIIKLNKANNEHRICEDKFKDYEFDTSVEKSFKAKEKWILQFFSMGCFHREEESIELVFEKGKAYLILKENREKKQTMILSEARKNELVFFEKKLKLMNRPNAGCTNSDSYKIISNTENYKINDSSCLWFGYNLLKEKLGFK